MLARTSQEPRIAFVLPGLGAGGSENIVNQLCNHFAALGWSVTLIAFEEPETRPYYAHHNAIRMIKLGMKSKRRNMIGATYAVMTRQKRLRQAFEIARPDIIVSFLTRTNIVSVLAARGMDIPVIVSERNNPDLQKVGLVWDRLRRWAYTRSAGLVTMTAGALRYFTSSIDVKGWVIPNPAPLPPAAVQSQSDGRTIGAVGRLVPQKGFDLLLDAFARAAPEIPGWRLIIWGEGPERAALEAQCRRLGIADRVALPGITCQPGEWIAQSDLFVLSSRFEGWGIVVGEAMAAGLPVISFDCEWGPAEMIEQGVSGMLVANGDRSKLGEAIMAMCRNPQARAEMGMAARERMQLFGSDKVLARWQAVIDEVLDHHRQGALV